MPDSFVLTINAGSSSLKFALFRTGQAPSRELTGKFERIGLPEGKSTVTDIAANKRRERSFQAPTHIACIPLLAEPLKHKAEVSSVLAVGHRVVHGGPRYTQPQVVDAAMLEELRRIRSLPAQRQCDMKLYSRLLGGIGIPTKSCVSPQVFYGSRRRSCWFRLLSKVGPT